ncbi:MULTISPECIES: hypothetical protein [Exiguobacterium]|uniref:hypothetical protein n=1 Tax=Exiguobacterium TaxID=33986 RepID=UPI001BE8C6DA|nr:MULTISPECIES: hypothetical protein [Exiguobacterium]MCT4782872.1 hypothetical protein [Exiguobacterium himgiriensis]
MTIILLLAGIGFTYALLLAFKQLKTLKSRIEQLEAEKHETEMLLLSFMESMNDVVKQDDVSERTFHESESMSHEPEAAPIQKVVAEQSDHQLVEETLLRHSVRDAARLLGKGEGEMALYAKFRGK